MAPWLPGSLAPLVFSPGPHPQIGAGDSCKCPPAARMIDRGRHLLLACSVQAVVGFLRPQSAPSQVQYTPLFGDGRVCSLSSSVSMTRSISARTVAATRTGKAGTIPSNHRPAPYPRAKWTRGGDALAKATDFDPSAVPDAPVDYGSPILLVDVKLDMSIFPRGQESPPLDMHRFCYLHRDRNCIGIQVHLASLPISSSQAR